MANPLEDVRDFGLTGEGDLPLPVFAYLQFTLNPIVELNPGSPFYLTRPPDKDFPVPLSPIPGGEQEQFTSTAGLFFPDQPRRKDAGVI